MPTISASSFDTTLFGSALNPQQPIDPNVISGVVTGKTPSGLSSQAVSAIFGFGSDIASNQATATVDTAKATQDTLEAQGYQIQGQGYQGEADAYARAQDIANKNSNLALVSGEVQKAQNARQVIQSLGAQKAAVAGSGFGNSGSSLFIYADTLRQGALGQQMIGTQAELNASAYQQQAAASEAEIAATKTAADYAGVAQQKALNAASVDQAAAAQAAAAGVASTTNLANTIAALTDQQKTTTTAATQGLPPGTYPNQQSQTLAIQRNINIGGAIM